MRVGLLDRWCFRFTAWLSSWSSSGSGVSSQSVIRHEHEAVLLTTHYTLSSHITCHQTQTRGCAPDNTLHITCHHTLRVIRHEHQAVLLTIHYTLRVITHYVSSNTNTRPCSWQHIIHYVNNWHTNLLILLKCYFLPSNFAWELISTHFVFAISNTADIIVYQPSEQLLLILPLLHACKHKQDKQCHSDGQNAISHCQYWLQAPSIFVHFNFTSCLLWENLWNNNHTNINGFTVLCHYTTLQHSM